MSCKLDNHSSSCLAKTTQETYDDDSFLKCLWNKDNEPTDEYVFFLINGSATTVLNCIVLVIAFLYVDTRKKPSQIFVINMTAADLLVGVFCQLSRPFAPCFPSYVCGPYYVAAWMFQMGSLFHLLLLNLEKFLSILAPLRYQILVTRRRVITLAIVSWVVLFIITVTVGILFLQFRYPEHPSCTRLKFNPEEYNAFFYIIAYVAPTVASFAISAFIFITALASAEFKSVFV